MSPRLAALVIVLAGCAAAAVAQNVPVRVQPSSLRFGQQAAGTVSDPKSVTLANNQNVPLAVTSIAASQHFLASHNCGAQLPARGQCTIDVRFAPTADGSLTGQLTVRHGASGGQLTVDLTGTARLPVALAPTSLSFGPETVGNTSAAKAIVLTNRQSVALTVSNVATSGDFSQTNNCGSVAAGGTCTISVRFRPTTIGARTGSLVVTHSASNSPQSAALSGTGTTPGLVSIAVTPASSAVALGRTQQFTATGTFANGSMQDLTASAVWSSSAPAVSSISNAAGSAGLATTLAQGPTTITATVDGVVGQTSLTVTAPELVSIAVTPTPVSVALGRTQQFTATGTYTNNSTQNLTAVATWTSSNQAVASINSAGLATSVSEGSTTIAAALNGISGAASLTVTAPELVSIAVTPTPVSVALGRTQQFTATGTYTNNSTQNLTATATWTSSNQAVASINSAGLATSVSEGSTTIAAALNGISGAASLTVTAPELVSIAVTPTPVSVALGRTQQFTATGTYTNNTTQNLTATATWTSSNQAAATINSGGLATSVSEGSTTIAAALNGISGTASLTVTAPELVSIAVTPTPVSVALGQTQQFTATGTYTNNTTQNLTATATWTSSNQAVATINSAGLATSVSEGSTTIAAAMSGVTGTASLTVTPRALVSIAVSPQGPTLVVGQTLQFTATGTYSDNTTQNLTATALWSSSATGIATISNAAATRGRATGVASGATIIIAAVGEISGNASLSVSPLAVTLVRIDVTPANPAVSIGGVRQLTATGTYSDNSTQDLTSTVAWTSSDSTVATISNAPGTQGLVSGVGTGSATITAASGTISRSTTVTTVAAFAYVPVNGPDGVAGFGVGAQNAAVVQLTGSPFAAVPTPVAVAVDPSGRFVYVANASSGVSGYTVDGPTGALTPIAGSPFGMGINAQDVVVDPLGRFVYATGNGAIAGFRIEATSGVLTALAGSPFLFTGAQYPWRIAIDPSGQHAYVTNYYYYSVSAFRIDGATGGLSAIGSPAATAQYATEVTVDARGEFVFVTSQSGPGVSVYRRSTETGALTPVPGSPFATQQSGRAVATTPNGAFVYVAHGSTLSAFVVDAATGVLTPVPGSPFAAPNGAETLAIDPSGRSAYVVGTSRRIQTFAIDGTTGALTPGGVTTWSGGRPSDIALALTRTSATATLTGLQIVPDAPTLVTSQPGATQQFSLVGTYSDGTTQFLTASATWTASNTSVATISNTAGTTGRATSVGYGTTTVSASFGGFTAQTTLTVNLPPLVALAITPSSPTILQGTAIQLTATGTFEDGTQRPVTAEVGWTSGNATVATVSDAMGSQGLATAVAPGTVAITATYGSRTASVTVTVVAAPAGTVATLRAAYVPVNGPDGIFGFGAPATPGAVAVIAGSPFAAVPTPVAVAVDPSGRFVYVANASSGVSGYTVDGPTGALTPIAGSPFGMGINAQDVVVDPLGRFVYATGNGAIAGFRIEATSGVLTALAGSPFLFTGAQYPWRIAIDPSGQHAYVTNYYYYSVSAFRIDGATGGLSAIGSPAATAQYATEVTVDARGEFVFVTSQSGPGVSVYRRSTETGALTPVPGSPFATQQSGRAVATTPNGAFVYVAHGSTLSAFVVDAATGVLTPVPGSPFAAPNGAETLAIDPSGRSAYVVGTSRRIQTFAIDGTTGALTPGGVTTWSGGRPSDIALALTRTSATATLTGLQIVPDAPTLVTSQPGATQQFSLVGTYSDGTTQFLTASATWTASNTSVATISNTAGTTGRATSVGYGTTTVSASFGGFTAQTTLTVKLPLHWLPLAISPSDPLFSRAPQSSSRRPGPSKMGRSGRSRRRSAGRVAMPRSRR